MSHLFPNYARKSIEIMEGKGNRLIDDQGKNYLDFTSGIGVANLGYHHPRLAQALATQAALLWHTPNLYHNHLQEEVATKLVQGQDYLAYFCNSGAEANEAALKMARKATGRKKIISFLHSFHGRTYGAMSATGQASVQQGYEPLVPGFISLPYNDLPQLKAHLDLNTAAVIMELIQGEGGVLPAQKKWVQAVSRLCQENGTLLIVDEVQTGMGRTGTFYAYLQYGIEPDIFTLAKGLGNGFPVGAMLGKSKLKEAFGPGSHGSTFGGNKMAMAVASEVCDLLQDPSLQANIKARSQQLFSELANLSTEIVEVRGKGLMIGLELKSPEAVMAAMTDLEAKGLLTLRAGSQVLRLLPPLTITEAEVTEALDYLKQVLGS